MPNEWRVVDRHVSYELLLKSRQGNLSEERLNEYFGKRLNYTFENRRARYSNRDTGVYFGFAMSEDEPGGPGTASFVVFSLNFYRSSYFVHEADPEVSTFVRAFDCVVLDPQVDTASEYQGDRFVSSWSRGNEAACRSLLQLPDLRQGQLTLPAARLQAIWQWNYARSVLQQDIGPDKFVPRISLMAVPGGVASLIVWTDGVPMFFPSVDLVIVYRQELAGAMPDFALMSSQEAMALLGPYLTEHGGGAHSMDYDHPPGPIINALRSLAALPEPPQLVAMDQVLDRELVERALAGR